MAKCHIIKQEIFNINIQKSAILKILYCIFKIKNPDSCKASHHQRSTLFTCNERGPQVCAWMGASGMAFERQPINLHNNLITVASCSEIPFRNPGTAGNGDQPLISVTQELDIPGGDGEPCRPPRSASCCICPTLFAQKRPGNCTFYWINFSLIF